MRAGLLQLLGCLALALALSECGPSQTTVVSGGSAAGAVTSGAGAQNTLSAAAKPALDPCAGMFHALCNDRELADLGDKMKSALAKAASTVSPQGLKVLAENEKGWLEAQRITCGIPSGATSLSANQATCLRSAFAARVQNAVNAVEKRGRFVFQRVEINRTDKVAPSNATRLMGPEAPKSVTHSIDFPRIDGDGAIVEKFNEAMRQAPRFKPSDQTEESTTYQIGYVGPDLISVEFDLRDLTIGAAHPNASKRAINFDMQTGTTVQAGDVFKPDTNWRNALAVRAAAELTKQLRAQDESARAIDPSDIRDIVSQPGAWFITDRALVLLFPAGVLGPAASDAYQVSIPWTALRPYLNPQGPGPIKGA